MNRIFYFFITLIFFSFSISCAHDSKKNDGGDTIVNDSITTDSVAIDSVINDSGALSESDTVVALDSAQIEKRVKEIWFKLRPEGDSAKNPAIPVLSSSLRPLYEKVYGAYLKAFEEGNEEVGMGLAEIIYGTWGATEPDPKGKFKFRNIESLSKNRVRVKLTYYNYSSPENHQLELKYDNGKWMLDEFDDFREYLTNAIKDPDFAPYFKKKTR
ncbi:MAG: hypothetical protein K2N05_01790 [Muribaculaceae bacterium]|nr:hypothetical protein [Muribaculaceae bacterium]